MGAAPGVGRGTVVLGFLSRSLLFFGVLFGMF